MILNVRKMRREQELSIDDLAQKAQVSPNTIYRIEHGENVDIRASTLLRIAHALGTTVANLIEE